MPTVAPQKSTLPGAPLSGGAGCYWLESPHGDAPPPQALRGDQTADVLSIGFALLKRYLRWADSR